MDDEVDVRLQALEDRVRALEAELSSEPKSARQKKPMSVKEFVLQKKPKDDVQKTLVIGYYLEEFNRMSSFNTRDLEVAFRMAKEAVPENINYKIIRNIDKGLITESGEKKEGIKAWMLTNTGIQAVERGFNEE